MHVVCSLILRLLVAAFRQSFRRSVLSELLAKTKREKGCLFINMNIRNGEGSLCFVWLAFGTRIKHAWYKTREHTTRVISY